jgi:endoglucanase
MNPGVAKGILIPLIIFGSFTLCAQISFHKGVNLTNWFQAASPRQIQFRKFSKKDFQNIKSLGCDVIRLPINLHAMTSGAPDYTLDPLFLNFLDQAVDWSEDLNIYLILDNHSFDPAVSTSPDIVNILIKVWPQLANRYKSRSDFLLYEVLNEPHGIADNVWGSIQQSVIDAIRNEDDKHQIIVGGVNYNSYTALANLPNYTDPKLIYTFHFYDPFLFTHQGASWVEPSMVPLSNMPFPYKASSMPGLPSSLKGTWIEGAYNNYANDGTVAKVKQLLDIAVNFKNSRNVPVFCGEFGVYTPNSMETDRVGWYKEVKNYLDQKSIPWTMWDYTGGFGLFEENSNELFDYDLNVPLLTSLDLVVPPQKDFYIKPLRNGFILYDDFVGEGIVATNGVNTGTLDYYNNAGQYDGQYCTYWTGVDQYDVIGFDFSPNIDLSLFPDHDFNVSFWVRGNSSGSSFDIRFVDTKTGSSDHPWRMGKTIDESMTSWDNKWHRVIVPLRELQEKGSWDDAWFNPENKFDWSAVDRFEIVAEQKALTGIEFFFDDLEVSGEEIPEVLDVEERKENMDVRIYPNPITTDSKIEFSLSKPEITDVAVYNSQGQLVTTLLSGRASSGINTIYWNGKDDRGKAAVAGLYFVRIYSETMTNSTKIIVLK